MGTARRIFTKKKEEKVKKVYNLQKNYEFITDDFGKVVNLTNYCRQNLTDDDYEMIAMRIMPPLYKFKFKCDKAKVWAILNS